MVTIYMKYYLERDGVRGLTPGDIGSKKTGKFHYFNDLIKLAFSGRNCTEMPFGRQGKRIYNICGVRKCLIEINSSCDYEKVHRPVSKILRSN